MSGFALLYHLLGFSRPEKERDLNSEKDRMGFIYSFDMSEQIAHFKRMPEHIQSSAECNVVDVIYESFVVPGDQDYLMSRR